MTTATATKPTTRRPNLGAKVDQLGTLNAQIAALNKEAEALKDLLKSSGQKEIVGKLFRAVVSTSSRTTLVADKVKPFLTEAQIKACSKTSTSTTLTMYGL